MSISKVGEQALKKNELQNKNSPLKIKKKTLNEDDYIEGIGDIIGRDFFPDLPKLRANAEYIEAWENNDHSTLRRLQAKYVKDFNPEESPSIYNTPSTFETPQRPSTSKEKTRNLTEEEAEGQKKKHLPQHLDTYLRHNTSEDNASFDQLMKDNDDQRRVKHAWLYDNEKLAITAKEEQLALPSIEQQAKQSMDTGVRKPLDSWSYQAYNTLMYNPKGEELSENEKIAEAKKSKREIHFENTRLPQKNQYQHAISQQIFNQAKEAKIAASKGRIGVDGKDLMQGLHVPTPSVNGYKFSATPSPMPGVDESPLMTWGSLEDTPLIVDHAPSSSVFHIPDVPKRDRIGLDLAEKVGKTMREKKSKALQSVNDQFKSPATRSPFMTSPMTPKRPLSMAAQKLLGSKLTPCSSDRALRASYTPSPKPHTSTPSTTPRRTPKLVKTPTLTKTPKLSNSLTRSSSAKNAEFAGKSATPDAHRRLSSSSDYRSPLVAEFSERPPSHTLKNCADPIDESTLTDNLLSLPKKRARASDYF